MINKSYKIWIILFISINLILLVWSIGYLNFLEEKFTNKDEMIVIEPDNIFKKKLPPKDENFSKEKSKLWQAFEDKEKSEKLLQNGTVKEGTLKKNNSKLENNLELGNDFKNKSKQLEDDKLSDFKSAITSKKEEEKNFAEEKKFNNQLVAKEDKIEKKK